MRLASVLALVFALVTQTLYIAFWNVENLFDIVDDPKVELDEEFTANAPKQWTRSGTRTSCRTSPRSSAT